MNDFEVLYYRLPPERRARVTRRARWIIAGQYGRIFGRAFLHVGFVAANTRFIAAGHYPAAFVTGFSISWVWWMNTRTAAHDETPWARVAYCSGAACGTVAGMFLAALWR